ncbi:hypothetical protein D9M72_640470 [compost metagenome]
MGITTGNAAAVIDFDHISIAARQPCIDDGARSRRANAGADGGAKIYASVQRQPPEKRIEPVAEVAGDIACGRRVAEWQLPDLRARPL